MGAGGRVNSGVVNSDGAGTTERTSTGTGREEKYDRDGEENSCPETRRGAAINASQRVARAKASQKSGRGEFRTMNRIRHKAQWNTIRVPVTCGLNPARGEKGCQFHRLMTRRTCHAIGGIRRRGPLSTFFMVCARATGNTDSRISGAGG